MTQEQKKLLSFDHRMLSKPAQGGACVTSQQHRKLTLASISVGGLTSTKLHYLLLFSQTVDILILQEVHEAGYQKLKERMRVNPAKRKWFFSKQPTKPENVVTFLSEELADRFPEVQGRIDRILELLVKLRTKVNLLKLNFMYHVHVKG
eukprot:snap_masked-scaffold_35-processed-gene-2.40-mRNA-1 protein AED:1.00 eAED:1.00 QI:0/-1/0/0/-1/1/1/0/148